MKKLLCILGCSGSGKSILCQELESKYGLKQIPSYTTRKPRYPNETGHTFISRKDFDDIRNNLVAYAETTGAEYGVTSEQIDKEDYTLYVVDYTGLKYLKEKYRGTREIISVYIDCPLTDRYERLRRRYNNQYHNNDESIEATLLRIEHDAVEFSQAAKDCDYVINNKNGNFPSTMSKLVSICIKNKIIPTMEV